MGAWDEALALAEAAEAPLPGKVVRWLYYTDADTNASFAEISAFLDDNPDWPGTGALARNAEAALVAEEDLVAAIAIAWFTRHPPRGGPGKTLYATALTAAGRGAEAEVWAARAWTEESLALDTEALLLAEFGAHFTAADHLACTDMLIWRGLTGEAKRMVPRLPEDARLLAEARIALRAGASGVDAAIARVPAEQVGDPRLVFERVRWRRRHDLTETAIELLRAGPEQAGPATAWWDERSILARRSMREGAWAEAYELVRAHGQTRRGEVAEAEWLAGWIALRHLGDAEAALAHFALGRAVVTTPVSLARAGYWSARAAEALGQGTRPVPHTRRRHGTRRRSTASSRWRRWRRAPRSRFRQTRSRRPRRRISWRKKSWRRCACCSRSWSSRKPCGRSCWRSPAAPLLRASGN